MMITPLAASVCLAVATLCGGVLPGMAAVVIVVAALSPDLAPHGAFLTCLLIAIPITAAITSNLILQSLPNYPASTVTQASAAFGAALLLSDPLILSAIFNTSQDANLAEAGIRLVSRSLTSAAAISASLVTLVVMIEMPLRWCVHGRTFERALPFEAARALVIVFALALGATFIDSALSRVVLFHE